MVAVDKSLMDPMERLDMQRDHDLCIESIRLYWGRRKLMSDPGWRAILRYQIEALARWVRSYREQLAR